MVKKIILSFKSLVIISVFISEDTTANSAWVILPARLLYVKTLIVNDLQVRPVSTHELDYGYFTLDGVEAMNFSNWRAATGTPKFAVIDMESDKARLVPAPTTSINVTVEGYTLPLPMVLVDDPVPSIPQVYHKELVVGGLAEIYTTQDVEIVEASQGAKFMAEWATVIQLARQHLRTDLRMQIRALSLPREFLFDTGAQASVPASDS